MLGNAFLAMGFWLTIISFAIMVLIVIPRQFVEMRIKDDIKRLRKLLFVLLILVAITTVLPAYIQLCRIHICPNETMVRFLSFIRSVNSLLTAVVLYLIYRVKY